MRRRVAATGLALVLLAGWWLVPAPAPAPAPGPREHAHERLADPVAAPAPGGESPAPDRVERASDEVRCTVGRAFEGRDCYVAIPIPGEAAKFWMPPGSYDGATFSFAFHGGDTAARLGCVPGDTVEIELRRTAEGMSCTVVGPLPDPLDAPLFGKVRGAADLPDGTVFLEGCGARDDDPVDADGGFFVQAEAGRCTMRAWRQAGMLRLPGPWVEIDAVAGREVEVEIAVPTFEPAGVGMGIEATGDAVRVTFLTEGGPGALGGLQPGDLISSVNGVPTDGMDLEDFIQHAIGPAGTDVRLEGVGADGEVFDVTVRRAIIAPPQ